MKIVIDAEIIKGYFEETVLQIETSLTSSVGGIFARLGEQDTAYLDDGGQIEHEWRNLVSPEWFDAWYAQQLNEGHAVPVPISDSCNLLRRKLEQDCGFPRRSRDFWYIKTAKTVTDKRSKAVIATEDLDFFDPTEKESASKTREKILRSSTGPVVRILARELILIKSVVCYCEYAATIADAE